MKVISVCALLGISLTDKFVPFQSIPALKYIFACLIITLAGFKFKAQIYLARQVIPLVSLVVLLLTTPPMLSLAFENLLQTEMLKVTLANFFKQILVLLPVSILLIDAEIKKIFSISLVVLAFALVFTNIFVFFSHPKHIIWFTDNTLWSTTFFGFANSYPRFQSFFTEPSKMGQFLILPVSIAVINRSRSSTCLNIIFLILILGLLLTQAIAVLFSGFVVLILYYGSKKRQFILENISALLVVIIFVLSALYYAFIKYPEQVGIYSRRSSLQYRIEEFTNLFQQIKISLGNWCLGDFSFAFYNNIEFPNVFLNSVYYGGIIGFLLHLLPLVILLKCLNKSKWAFVVLWAYLSSLTYGPLEQRSNLMSLAFFIVDSVSKNTERMKSS